MSRASDALIAQANLQTLRERAYDRYLVDFANGHPEGDEAPGSYAERRAAARLEINEVGKRLVESLDAAIDAQAELTALLREDGRRG